MQNPLAMILRIISTVYMAANTYLEKRKQIDIDENDTKGQFTKSRSKG